MTPTVKPEELIDRAHPLGVALGQIVVDGDDVHAAPFERARVDRQRGDERLAFAGLHLGDPAFVQHLAAHDLHVEVPHPNGAFAGLAHDGEDLGQQGIERLAVLETLPELGVLARSPSSESAENCSSSALTARRSDANARLRARCRRLCF